MKKIQLLLMLWAVCLPLLAQNTTGDDAKMHTLSFSMQPEYAYPKKDPIQLAAGD